jgi:hypothetical protein
MLQVPGGPRVVSTDFAARRQVALERIHDLIARYDERARLAFRNYYLLQGLTIGLAAITPCLIVIAKDNPRVEFFNWLQLFVPAIAAIAAGLSHVFRWREDGVRYTALAEAIRSQLWRFETRAAELGIQLSEEQALDRLVTQVDELNLAAVKQWSSAQLADARPPDQAKATAG